ncbi:toll-like receptor 4 [Patella vulgata]|uniref:toll-like receptor 4 n=1 Tax=Patella vulgata TaxID=6465 RepID=UPI0021802EA6|nr:toll-like receptor 4 [Patella vulgata]
MCNCTGNVAVCSGHRHLLSYIPKLPAMSIGVLLLILAISLVYRYRWHLRYFVYILRYHHLRLQRFATERRSYQYDIYLSCSEDDVDFILENILPRLEHELNLHVFLPQRDGLY